MMEQQMCACGCGNLVLQHDGKGRPGKYFHPSCRKRAQRIREAGYDVTKIVNDVTEIQETISIGTQPIVLPFGVILADPPWRFANRTGKVAPEHQRLMRYPTMALEEIEALPVREVAGQQAHLYLWVPNALLAEGLVVMRAWGFVYKTNLVWVKVRRDGGPDGRGVGFYYRNVTELCLFGVRGQLRTLAPGRRQVNVLPTRKREHSRKPDELYEIIEQCSPGPYLELFARYRRAGWTQWGNQLEVPWGDRETSELRGESV